MASCSSLVESRGKRNHSNPTCYTTRAQGRKREGRGSMIIARATIETERFSVSCMALPKERGEGGEESTGASDFFPIPKGGARKS